MLLLFVVVIVILGAGPSWTRSKTTQTGDPNCSGAAGTSQVRNEGFLGTRF